MDGVIIDPKIKGGVPVIKGTRVPVRSIVFLYYKKQVSPEEIAIKYYTYVSLYQIKNAIKWYELNKNNYEGLDL